MRVRLAMLVALLLAASLAGCGSATDSDRPTVTVFAAASLTTPFTELGQQFEKSHDGVQVKFNFAGSSDLVSQIEQGAPADVFASADTRNMDKAGDTVEDPVVFASNTLMIAVPPGNRAGIRTAADLTGAGVKLVICAPQVPCGTAAATVAEHTGLQFRPVSEEQSVTDVLNKVATGEADAGLVYVSDVRSAGDDVEGIAFPESAAAVNYYPIGVVAASKQHRLAKDFVALVTGATGQRVLAEAGFAKPQR